MIQTRSKAVLFVIFSLALLAQIIVSENPCSSGFVPFIKESAEYDCIEFSKAFRESLDFLDSNLPSFDVINRCTLGFCGNASDENGVAIVSTTSALQVKQMGYNWANSIPRDIWNEYVLPYANVNEGRSDWRQLFLPVVQSILTSSGNDINKMTTTDVVYAINSALWSGPMGKNIVFKSSQTPLIYDPMSTLAFGYASCTGVSIFFVDALRSIGVASRLAGTPAWNGNISHGNHNWVEVWDPATGWQFIEATPASAGETLFNPCDKWFCNPSSFANGTQVFATQFSQDSKVRYPMAWDRRNTQIPGVDRTSYYQKVCMAC